MTIIRHHYVDTDPSTVVVDAPEAKSVTKAASRIYAAMGETVQYCAAGDARDWTTASDAGFLPVQLQQDTGDQCTAVGTFRDSLAVFFPSAAQIWGVATDPAQNQINDRLYGIGTLAPLSSASFANDLAFLSPFGVRSMAVSSQTDRIDDADIGTAIDALIKADLIASEGVSQAYDPLGVWIHGLGQYWLIIDMGSYSKAWVYSYSRQNKIAAWSEYEFPVRITGATALNGQAYVRTADSLYLFDPDQYTDDGAPITVEAQMSFQDAKTPGVAKQFYGADFVIEGSAEVSYLYDPRDLGKETTPYTLSGDTRPDDMAPVEVCSTSIAPVFRHEANEAFELASATLYYNVLGTV